MIDVTGSTNLGENLGENFFTKCARLLVKSKSSWWNVWNLGEILNHLVKLNFTKIKTIQEIWCILLITHYSYLVYLAYKSYSKKCTIWYGRYVHVVWSIHCKYYVWSIHWKSHIVLLCGLYLGSQKVKYMIKYSNTLPFF